jgi:hypothetical protein
MNSTKPNGVETVDGLLFNIEKIDFSNLIGGFLQIIAKPLG